MLRHITSSAPQCQVEIHHYFVVNVRILVETIIDPEKEDIIFINTARKFNSSAGQCLIGLHFIEPANKKSFEERVMSFTYKFTELKANDPLLKILL